MILFFRKHILSVLKNKKTISALLLSFVFCFVLAESAHAASIGDAVSTVLGWIAALINSVLGLLLTLLIYILMDVAKFNGIINVETVVKGWIIIRDLCNMFFILILLVIAFSTILKIESYSAKRLLPKLLIMAVLINFSRTIFGLIIDFGQVVMLTFVNAFGSVGANNLIVMFNVQDISKLNTSIEVNPWGTSAASIAGVFALITTVIVVCVMLAVLVMRVVMLWIYTIFSPLIFLGFAFPPIQKYTGRIWEDFIKQVTIGPILAFFLWLALTTASSSSEALSMGIGSNSASEELCSGLSTFFCSGNLQKFIITIGLLMGGLMMAQQAGGVISKAASKAEGWVKGGAKFVGRPTKALGSYGVDKLSEATKVDWNVSRGWGRLQNKIAENKSVRAQNVENKVIASAQDGGRLATLSHGALAWDNVRSWKGMKRLALGKRAGMGLRNDLNEKVSERKEILSANDQADLLKQRGEILKTSTNLKTKEKEFLEDIHVKEENVRNAKNLGASKDDIKEAEAKLNDSQNKYDSLKLEMNNADESVKTIDETLKSKKIDDKKTTELDSEITKLKEKVGYYNLKNGAIAMVTSDAKIEGEQAAKISRIDNSDQLGEILVEAIEEQNQGLIAAVSKKMAKMSDYNEMMAKLKLGTGTEGMHKLAEKFQKEGGMTEQGSLALISEIGNIAKNVNHFGGFGAATLENGSWRKSTEDEAQTAQLAEMMKIQPQMFARSVNRLGIGFYKEGVNGEQSGKTWEISKAGLAYMKLNQKPLAEEYKKTGNQNALEHLALDSTITLLGKNQIKDGEGSLINTVKYRATGQGSNIRQVINSIKK